jgi:DNA topoisomerase IB
MANSTKITQKMAINYVMDNFELPEEYEAKFKAMLESLEKKTSSKKMTTGQKENEVLKGKILEVMEDNTKYRVGDIMKLVGLDSSQKTSALVRQLKESGLVDRVVEKGVAYFTKA